MANPKVLDKRRKSVKNIAKITRTMELIATARFKKAMDRATAATAYTNRMAKLVNDLTCAGLEVSHPLLEPRDKTRHGKLLVLTANRGLCGGFNGSLIRAALGAWSELKAASDHQTIEVSGKRGITGLKFRGIEIDQAFTHFEDKPRFDEADVLATRLLDEYAAGRLDRLDVVYMKFESVARQSVVVEQLLPLGGIDEAEEGEEEHAASLYEFLPSPESILEEIIPMSFKIKLFKRLLDSAVSEQVSRMVAMKGATENAGDLIKRLSMQYNRARQGRITSELIDLIGGVEAIS